MSTDREAQQILTEVRRLRGRAAARAHGGVWLPVALLAALVLLSIGLYRAPFDHPYSMTVDVPYWAGLPSEQRDPVASYLFWFAGAPVAFLLIAIWYRRRDRRTGTRVPWRWAVAAGLGALAALAVLAAVPAPLPPGVPLDAVSAGSPTLGHTLLHGLLTPLLPVAVAVLVLGVAERSRPLVAAGAWVGLVAWLHCTFGLANLASRLTGGMGSVNAASDTSPGPLLLAMAAPLVAFLVVAVARARRACAVPAVPADDARAPRADRPAHDG